jgi:ribosomal protein S21
VTEVKKKKGETFESLYRRFNKKLLQSGKILQAKKVKYSDKPISRNKRKDITLRRLNIKSKRDYLRKIGKLKDEG